MLISFRKEVSEKVLDLNCIKLLLLDDRSVNKTTKWVFKIIVFTKTFSKQISNAKQITRNDFRIGFKVKELHIHILYSDQYSRMAVFI